jgi:hypothetical protein
VIVGQFSSGRPVVCPVPTYADSEPA